jgi:Flp pilus assembly protein TadD
MPALGTVDISHEQVTDHDIEVHLKSQPAPRDSKSSAIELVPVGDFKAGNRELGLAYAQFAERGDRKSAETALRLLSTVPPIKPADVEVMVRLGFLQQVNGDVAAARAAYRSALEANPWEPTALGNLAVLDAGSGKAGEAIQLLQKLVNADPSQTKAGLNLAFIECELHQTEDAKSILNRLARSNPDDPQLRQFLKTGTYLDRHCSLPGITSLRCNCSSDCPLVSGNTNNTTRNCTTVIMAKNVNGALRPWLTTNTGNRTAMMVFMIQWLALPIPCPLERTWFGKTSPI